MRPMRPMRLKLRTLRQKLRLKLMRGSKSSDEGIVLPHQAMMTLSRRGISYLHAFLEEKSVQAQQKSLLE